MLTTYLWYAIGLSIGMAYVLHNAAKKEAIEDKAKYGRTPRKLAFTWVVVTWILLTVAMCTKDLQSCSDLWVCRISWWLIAVLLFAFQLGVWKALQDPDTRKEMFLLDNITTV